MKKTITIAKAFKMRAAIRKEIADINISTIDSTFGLSEQRITEETVLDKYDFSHPDLQAKLEKAYAEMKNPKLKGKTFSEFFKDYIAAFEDWNTLNIAIDKANQKVRELLLEEDHCKKLVAVYERARNSRANALDSNPTKTLSGFTTETEQVGETANGTIRYEKVKKPYKKIVLDALSEFDFEKLLDDAQKRIVEIRDEITYIDNSTKIEVELKRDWR